MGLKRKDIRKVRLLHSKLKKSTLDNSRCESIDDSELKSEYRATFWKDDRNKVDNVDVLVNREPDDMFGYKIENDLRRLLGNIKNVVSDIDLHEQSHSREDIKQGAAKEHSKLHHY